MDAPLRGLVEIYPIWTLQIAKALNLPALKDRKWHIQAWSSLACLTITVRSSRLEVCFAFQACSGKTGDGLDSGMQWLIEIINH